MTPERWSQIDRIFQLAVELPSAERDVLLEQSCGDDDALRREVEAMLRSDREVSPVIDRNASEMAVGLLDAATLTPGQMLGHYEVRSMLGAGGMGEVYLAHDITLKRDVALKVLPRISIRDPARLSRFRREAEMLASLNHPNIAVIHGIEEAGASPSIVLEYVEGETLQQRLEKGPLDLEEAFRVAQQIAEALEAAHGKGLIHCDLKPANVKVTHGRKVKLLDFGIARMTLQDEPRAPARAGETTSPSVGTPAYMSPEQVKGSPGDRGSDIWAFGCVLYEMLAGAPAFPGNSITEIFFAVTSNDPDWTALPVDTPYNIRTLLRRCLQKDELRRLRDITDVRIEIEETLSGEAIPEKSASPEKRRRTLMTVAAAILILAGVSGGIETYRSIYRTVIAPVTRFAIPAPFMLNAAISPDGQSIVYTTQNALNPAGPPANPNEQHFYLKLRRMDSPTEVILFESTGTLFDGPPLWSPDGRMVGFILLGKLKTVEINTRKVRDVCDVPGRSPSRGHVASWGKGAILLEYQTGIYQVAPDGGVPIPVKEPDSSARETRYRFPRFLPNGRDFLFMAESNQPDAAEIRVASLDSGRAEHLLPLKSAVMYAEPGYLLFTRDDALVAQRFDPGNWALRGNAIEIQKPTANSTDGWLSVDISKTGTMISSPDLGAIELRWFDRNGNHVEGAPSLQGTFPTFSRDETRISIQGGRTNPGVALFDLGSGISTQLTSGVRDLNPRLSPDGTTVAFTRRNDSFNDTPVSVKAPNGTTVVYPRSNSLYIKSVEGDQQERLMVGLDVGGTTGWSPDGKYVVYTSSSPAGGDVMAVSVSDGRTWPLVDGRFNDRAGVISPKGQLAYMSDPTGRFEIYVRNQDGATPRQVSMDGGTAPAWRPDGEELFFVTLDKRNMMSVEIPGGDLSRVQPPRKLFSIPQPVAGTVFDVTAGGQRFVIPQIASPAERAINVVLNWTGLLSN